MNVSWLDWGILGTMVAGIFLLALYSRRYMRGVADFLAANRVAGRYLMTVSNTFLGAIWVVALWEMVYSTGLPTQWWSMMSAPVLLFLALTGFIVYRFRQTRALTLAQFFEERYSRRFRLFSALLCWLSGILNYGIFPAITARLLVYFLRLPTEVAILGWQVPTIPLVMLAYLSLAVFVACAGGQIAIMITDFLQGSVMMLSFVVISLYLLARFSWPDLMAGLACGSHDGVSLTDPFGGSATSDFNIFYFLIGVVSSVYNVKSWQGNSGYNAAAKTPHEAVMAGVISNWRTLVANIGVAVLIPVTAYAVLHLPQFHSIAAPIEAQIERIADPQLRFQMTVPLVISNLLPAGLFGLFAAVLIGTAVSFDDTYLHSWGSIFIQDVVTPLRGKPFSPKRHLLLLRLSIVGVALFAFVFSCLFDLKTYVFQFFALTGAIYLGGAGAVIIGGLYWKRGTTRGAYAALLTGTVLGFGGIVLEQNWDTWAGTAFPLTGQWIYFIAMATASLVYVAVSWLWPEPQPYDLDRLLHRGVYADPEQDTQEPSREGTTRLGRLLGISANFSRFERLLFYASFGWMVLWWCFFLIISVTGWLAPDWLPENFWPEYWYWNVWLNIGLGIVCTIWIFCGGCRDAGRMFRDLRHQKIDSSDDGFVAEPSDQSQSVRKSA